MPDENLPPAVISRIAKEIQKILKSKPEGIRLIPNEEDITDVKAVINGPPGTPYEGGQFKMRLVFGSDYPAAPPKGYFLTKMFHPNVSSKGEICVNTLKRDWDPKNGIDHILTVVKCLLIHPNPESALNEEAGKMLLEEYDNYAKRAKLFTSIHAMKDDTSAKKKSTDPSSKVKRVNSTGIAATAVGTLSSSNTSNTGKVIPSGKKTTSDVTGKKTAASKTRKKSSGVRRL